MPCYLNLVLTGSKVCLSNFQNSKLAWLLFEWWLDMSHGQNILTGVKIDHSACNLKCYSHILPFPFALNVGDISTPINTDEWFKCNKTILCVMTWRFHVWSMILTVLEVLFYCSVQICLIFGWSFRRETVHYLAFNLIFNIFQWISR